MIAPEWHLPFPRLTPSSAQIDTLYAPEWHLLFPRLTSPRPQNDIFLTPELRHEKSSKWWLITILSWRGVVLSNPWNSQNCPRIAPELLNRKVVLGWFWDFWLIKNCPDISACRIPLWPSVTLQPQNHPRMRGSLTVILGWFWGNWFAVWLLLGEMKRSILVMEVSILVSGRRSRNVAARIRAGGEGPVGAQKKPVRGW